MSLRQARRIAVTDAVLTSSNVTEAETLWSAAATYALNAAVYVIEDGVHQRYVSLAGSNLNKPPATSPTWWRAEDATNRWAMFDAISTSTTTNATSIVVTLTMPAETRFNVLYLEGLLGRTVRVEVSDPTAGAVYDETFDLADVSGVTDWYEWYFAPVSYKTELLVTDLPPGAGSILTVTIGFPGGTAACANLVAGLALSLGTTKWGVKTEIRDYSVFADDGFGGRVLVRRAYRRLASAEAIIENRLKDAIEGRLTETRADLALYILDDNYSTLVIFGLARWSVAMSLPPDRSLCSLELESNAAT